MERHNMGRPPLDSKLGGSHSMSEYELAMLIIAVLTLIVNAVALFRQKKN